MLASIIASGLAIGAVYALRRHCLQQDVLGLESDELHGGADRHARRRAQLAVHPADRPAPVLGFLLTLAVYAAVGVTTEIVAVRLVHNGLWGLWRVEPLGC
jgi:hypothetical protein